MRRTVGDDGPYEIVVPFLSGHTCMSAVRIWDHPYKSDFPAFRIDQHPARSFDRAGCFYRSAIG